MATFHWLTVTNGAKNSSQLLTSAHLLTYSIQQSPSSEANRFSVSQEIPSILWNPKLLHCIKKFSPPVHNLSQINPVHATQQHFLKIHLNIILPSMPGYFKWSLSLRFPHQNPVYTSPLGPCVLHAPPVSFLSIWSPEEYLVRICHVFRVLAAYH